MDTIEIENSERKYIQHGIMYTTVTVCGLASNSKWPQETQKKNAGLFHTGAACDKMNEQQKPLKLEFPKSRESIDKKNVYDYDFLSFYIFGE